MGIARRRWFGHVMRVAAVFVLPVSILIGRRAARRRAPRRRAPRRRVAAIQAPLRSIPFKRLSSDDIKKPGRWRG